MGGDIIEQVFEHYGMTGLIVFICALVSFAVFVKYISTKIPFGIPWARRVKTPVDSTLKDHLFFTNAKFKLRFDIPTLELLSDHPRIQQMYRDLIYLNVEAFYYGCGRIITISDIETMSGTEWSSVVKSELRKMLTTYEEKAVDFGVPAKIIAGYGKWLSTYTELLMTYIDQLGSSNVYGNSVLRTNVFLLVMNLLMVTMIGDLDKLARESKDSVSGIEYRGNALEDS